MKTLIARWESRSGKHVAELWKAEGSGFYYRGAGCGGYLGNDISQQDAIAIMESRTAVGAGYFQPDKAKTPMQRTV